MANYCASRLVVSGDPAEIKKFKEKAASGEEVFDIAPFAPVPEELAAESAPQYDEEKATQFTERYGAPDWYSWSVKNWGTSRRPHESVLTNDEEDSLEYEYMTAWSPIGDSMLLRLSLDYPGLHFEMMYAEQSSGFWGMRTFANGEEYESRDGEVSYNEDTHSYDDGYGGDLPKEIEGLASLSG